MDIVEADTSQDNAQHMGKHAGCQKIGHFNAVYKSRKVRKVNEIEQTENQGEEEEDIEMVSTDSIQFNTNHSVLTANL